MLQMKIKMQKRLGLILALLIGLIATVLMYSGSDIGFGLGVVIATAPFIWFKDGKFTQLTSTELKELSVEQLSQYNSDFVSHKLKNTVSADDLKKSFENTATKSDIDLINKQLEVVNSNLKNIDDKKTKQMELSVKEQIVSKIKNNQIEDGKIKVKATATTANAVTDRTLNHRLDGVHRTASPKFAMTDFFPTIRVNDPNSFDELSYIDYDEASIVRAAAARAEGNAVAESELVLIEKVVKLYSIADSMSLTSAAKRRSDIFAREIDFFLRNNMARKINQALYNGSGVAPNTNGIYTQAPTFNAGAYAGKKIQNANMADLGLIMKKEIEKGKEQDYVVDFAFVTWDDYIDLIGGLKTADDQYIMPNTHGITYIPSSFVTTNTAVFGCSEFVKIYTTEDYDFEVGYKSGNWEKRISSVLVETVMNLLIRHADSTAFLKVTDVTAALTAISI